MQENQSCVANGSDVFVAGVPQRVQRYGAPRPEVYSVSLSCLGGPSRRAEPCGRTDGRLGSSSGGSRLLGCSGATEAPRRGVRVEGPGASASDDEEERPLSSSFFFPGDLVLLFSLLAPASPSEEEEDEEPEEEEEEPWRPRPA